MSRPKELLKPTKTRYILLSFAIALLIKMLPFGSTMVRYIPDFSGMLVLYWTINQPRKFGIGWSCIVGLACDMTGASTFGQHALAYTLSSYLVTLRQRQLIMYNLGQQALVVLALLLFNHGVMSLARLITGSAFVGWSYFVSPFIGSLLWPLLTTLLLLLQRRGHRT